MSPAVRNLPDPVTEDALRHLGGVRRTWIEIDLPFELARTRTLLARAHAALGDGDAAAMEERAALALTSRIGTAAPPIPPPGSADSPASI